MAQEFPNKEIPGNETVESQAADNRMLHWAYQENALLLFMKIVITIQPKL